MLRTERSERSRRGGSPRRRGRAGDQSKTTPHRSAVRCVRRPRPPIPVTGDERVLRESIREHKQHEPAWLATCTLAPYLPTAVTPRDVSDAAHDAATGDMVADRVDLHVSCYFEEWHAASAKHGGVRPTCVAGDVCQLTSTVPRAAQHDRHRPFRHKHWQATMPVPPQSRPLKLVCTAFPEAQFWRRPAPSSQHS